MEQIETKKSKQPESGKKKEPDFLKQYRQCYPDNKTFYVTTDRMVFLEGEEDNARLHQHGMGKGEVSTY